MASYDSGAINGVDDTSQSIYRPLKRKPQTDAATDTPTTPSTPAAAATPASTPSAYDRGAQARAMLGNAVDDSAQSIGALARAGGALTRSAIQPIADIAVPAGNFTRGLVGVPENASFSPISSAAAATPPQITRPTPAATPSITSLPTMTVNAPNAPQPAARTAPTEINNSNVGDYLNSGSARFASTPGTDDAAAKANLLARTPTFGGGALTRPDISFNQDPVYQAQQQAKSDTASILSRDPRSALGIAARNAQVEAGDSRTGRANYQRTVEQAIGGIQNNVANAQQTSLEGQRAQAQLENTGLQGQNELTRENVRANAELNKPDYQADANGNLVRVSGTGAKQVTNADGSPLNVPGKINAAYEAAASRHAAELIKAGVDPDEAEQRGIAFAQNIRSGQGGKPQASATPKVPDGMKSFAGYSARGNPVFVDAQGKKHEDVQ
jgi:hypothetical protein